MKFNFYSTALSLIINIILIASTSISISNSTQHK
jgi:hypothetical protein